MRATLDPELVREAAVAQGVCARPVISRVTDMETGEVRLVPIWCGSTCEDRCPACAERARRLRMQQCREGWHLDTEPEWQPDQPDEADDGDDQADDELDDHEPGCERRVRSTRRRQDVADLPRLPMEDRTIGRVYTAPDGKTYRPSMFLTLTLGSYGPVRADGTPVDPDRYDYRRAALDALHFPKLVDRFWQNLRRCAGYHVQYFATIEAQRRLAPHLHAAMRGTIPRRAVRQVRAATYHQLWWPAHDTPVYTDRLPQWTDRGYIDPDTGELLPTWDEALDALDADPEAEPAHVVRFGDQDDLQGLLAGTPGADRAIGYLCKYLAKDIATTHDDPDDSEPSPARAAHIDRVAEEVRWLPCAPTCANWLRYGIQPKDAGPGMVPGHCPHKAHDRANLGLGGRRVLVSRQWSGKTLAGHRADRAAIVRAALEEAGYDPDDHDELSVVGSEGRWSWELLGRSRVDAATYAAAISQAITTRQRWRAEYEAAKTAAGPAPGRASATHGRRKFDSRATCDGGSGTVSKQRLLTVEQVAELLGTSVRFPRRLIAERRITFVRIGRHVRIPEREVLAMIDAGTVEAVDRRARSRRGRVA
jgi:excisionase family DNA binding protein